MKQSADKKIPLINLIKSTLSTRLSIALILIVIVSSSATVITGQHWMQQYNAEVAQTLNENIAMYITNEYELLEEKNEKPNLDAINALSHQAMIINPIAEVYLLDLEGNIIAHAHTEPVKTERISLDSIKTFLERKQPYPIYGTDPRHPNQNQIFSAAEIRNNKSLQGYLYVVLGSKLHQDISNSAKHSQSLSMAVISIIMIAMITIILGLTLFSLLIKPLRDLSEQVQSFTCLRLNRSGNNNTNQYPLESIATKHHESTCMDLSHRDEILQLRGVFNEMSDQIGHQFNMLNESDIARRELVANISHDLRTPLSSIQGYLETLAIKNNHLSSSERSLYLKKAINSSNRLCQLIGDLFELSKLDSPSAQPNFESFSLIELAYDTLQGLEIDFEKKGISYEIKAPANNLFVYADISLIQRVFENLIRNAITYTPDNGSITLHFDTGTNNALDTIKISILDNGRGIDEDELPHIFDRFYKNPNNSREGINSTGLGLAIVKRILELHNSPITVQSKVNQGTCFEFSLPYAS